MIAVLCLLGLSGDLTGALYGYAGPGGSFTLLPCGIVVAAAGMVWLRTRRRGAPGERPAEVPAAARPAQDAMHGTMTA